MVWKKNTGLLMKKTIHMALLCSGSVTIAVILEKKLGQRQKKFTHPAFLLKVGPVSMYKGSRREAELTLKTLTKHKAPKDA